MGWRQSVCEIRLLSKLMYPNNPWIKHRNGQAGSKKHIVLPRTWNNQMIVKKKTFLSSSYYGYLTILCTEIPNVLSSQCPWTCSGGGTLGGWWLRLGILDAPSLLIHIPQGAEAAGGLVSRSQGSSGQHVTSATKLRAWPRKAGKRGLPVSQEDRKGGGHGALSSSGPNSCLWVCLCFQTVACPSHKLPRWHMGGFPLDLFVAKFPVTLPASPRCTRAQLP